MTDLTTGPWRLSTRRNALAGAAAVGFLLSSTRSGLATTRIIVVTAAGYGADPTGSTDSTSAFQKALNVLTSAGGGTLQIPPGTYLLAGSLSCSGTPITIEGYGQHSSVLKISHAGAALSYVANSVTDSLVVRDIGFYPTTSPLGGTALSVVFPTGQSGWQSCLIENVDFNVPAGGTMFTRGVYLKNVWKSRISNCVLNGNYGSGTSFATLDGFWVDDLFEGCNIQGVDNAIVIANAGQGLRVISCVLIATTSCLSTGSSTYGNGANVDQLTVSQCEFSCSVGPAMNLLSVYTGWVSQSHFGASSGSPVVCQVTATTNLQITECAFTGSAAQGSEGINFSNSGTLPCSFNQIDDCQLQFVATGVAFNEGTTNNTGKGLRMIGLNGQLIGSPVVVNGVNQVAVQDSSGNTTNEVEWIASATAPNDTTNRLLYLH